MSGSKLSPHYALDKLNRALASAQRQVTSEDRDRAQEKIERWTLAVQGILSGASQVGSRTPLKDIPAWVTLEVVTGGFVTGRLSAEGDLLPHEEELSARLGADAPGETPREKINTYYLSDQGQTELWSALQTGSFSIELPEEGVLPTVVWLLEHDHASEAMELLATIEPLKHRLRFYPRLQATPQTPRNLVKVETIAQVRNALNRVAPQRQVSTMNEAILVWHPLLDRLVSLWLETVEGEAPTLEQQRVIGGWPCKRFDESWREKRRAWLQDYEEARAVHTWNTKHAGPKSNFGHLQRVLVKCEVNSAQLTPREVGLVRRALANCNSRRGLPGSPEYQALRAAQAEQASPPSKSDIRDVLMRRLEPYSGQEGLRSVESILAEVTERDLEKLRGPHPIPPSLIPKVMRALEAPVEDLIKHGVITSSETLALVIPQLTAEIRAIGLTDPVLNAIYTQVYTAFRRRRSLLLLNLESQVKLHELPWVAALERRQDPNLKPHIYAQQALKSLTLLSLTAFPHTIFPNRLIQEMQSLTAQAQLKLTFTQELATDIFMNTFTPKWPQSMRGAIKHLEGSLYARYYDLPDARDALELDFDRLCQDRSAEARTGHGSWTAEAGAVIEQSQILTTHNLSALVFGLDLQEEIALLAPQLAERCFDFVIWRQRQMSDNWRGQLQMLKNIAYAWRQAIFFLSLCPEDAQEELIAGLPKRLESLKDDRRDSFELAVTGLRLVQRGERFDSSGHISRGEDRDRERGRRLLGWSIGSHWLLSDSIKLDAPSSQPIFSSYSSPQSSFTSALIPINSATPHQLKALKGIGDILAGRIIAHREQHGPFTTHEDILKVYGISATLLSRMTSRITLE